tara:strand:- start:2793 stop:3206 length:414 start_codon:yes stop_codon:yes gene_type:complete
MPNKTIPKSKKKPSRSKLVKKLDTVFSQYIRLKNSVDGYATCFTCGKKDHWKKLQNGHFQSRKHYATRWNEQNCQVQCAGCNVFRYGEQFLFAKNLDERFYAGLSDELYIKAKQIVKYTNSEIEDMILKYKNLVDSM